MSTRIRSGMPSDTTPISEDVVRRTAKIIGPNSAAQRALDEVERRLKEGQKNPVILHSRKAASFFVMDYWPV